MISEQRLAELKKICACIPFAESDAGLTETMDAMRELIEQRIKDAHDIEIMQEALDKLAYPTTIGPAMMGNLGEAADNEIRLRAELADRERKRCHVWIETQKQLEEDPTP